MASSSHTETMAQKDRDGHMDREIKAYFNFDLSFPKEKKLKVNVHSCVQ